MILLDLFCGAGGAAMGYNQAGFDEILGVDISPQKSYPFQFIRADATKFPLEGFDAVHASPPCQAFTQYRRRGDGVGDGYPDLVDVLRKRLIEADVTYVIENVPGAPLLDPVQYCGSSFGLDIRRHRLFESNVPLLAPPCDHGWQTPRFKPASNRKNLRSTVEIGAGRQPMALQKKAMGIDWMTRRELTEAVPPAYTHHIGLQLVNHLKGD